jgi:hypothetical protein
MARPNERPLTVLILGGYGAFGGQLARLLSDEPRLTLVIAGRSRDKAETFCRSLRGAARCMAAEVDRDGDLRAAFAPLAPDVVVDASGPFQAYGENPYRVPASALAAGAHYLDLADGSEFVRGIVELDGAAKAAGKAVLSGVSSFPVLHAAVVRALARGLDRVDSSTVGIAPVPYAGVGETVMRAVAGYAGKPIRLRRDGRTATAHALTETRRFTIAPPGGRPLDPLTFSLIDVPDLEALAGVRPEIRSVWAGAAPTPACLHALLRLLARCVRWHILPSLEPFAPLMHRVANALRRRELRGGMFVQIEGARADGVAVKRSWHLVAEGEDGPRIPSMAAAILVRRILEGRVPAPGARSAIHEIELGEYERAFIDRAIETGMRVEESSGDVPLYKRVLGEAWRRLPAVVRDLHGSVVTSTVTGRATVERGRGLLANAIANLFGFPRSAPDVELRVTFVRERGVETWRREFGARTLRSVQLEGKGSYAGLLCERFGPFTFGLALVVGSGRLELVPQRWDLLGMPLPRSWSPRGTSFEMETQGRFAFDVAIQLPLVGRLVRYSGWLEPASTLPLGDAMRTYLD